MTRADVRALISDACMRAGIGGVDPRVVVLVASLTVVIAVVCAVRWMSSGDSGLAFDGVGARGSVASPDVAALEQTKSASVEPSTTMLWVHVVGAVRSPGVVCLAENSRVADAVDAVGGLLANAQVRGVNLARALVDGEQIVVPTQDEWEAASAAAPIPSGSTAQGSGSVGSAAVGRVDLNSATAADLDALPGVGPSTAEKIIADRDANGPFAAPEDLMRVSGIGPKKFEALKELISVP